MANAVAPATHRVLPIGARRWPAQLSLGLEQRRGQTILVRRSHNGPLLVQSPFYPGDGTCHLYLLHPPGGLVGGDELTLEVAAGASTETLLTTPAATKFYRCDGRCTRQVQTLRVATGAHLEWTPQENIVFDGGDVEASTRFDLAPGARLLGWETWCLGRPVSDEPFASGRIAQSLEVWVADHPLLIERLRVTGNSPALRAAWGLSSYAACTTALAYPATAEDLEHIRRVPYPLSGGEAAATLVDGLLIIRARAPGTRQLNPWLRRLWHELRPRILNRHPLPPRIWAT